MQARKAITQHNQLHKTIFIVMDWIDWKLHPLALKKMGDRVDAESAPFCNRNRQVSILNGKNGNFFFSG